LFHPPDPGPAPSSLLIFEPAEFESLERREWADGFPVVEDLRSRQVTLVNEDDDPPRPPHPHLTPRQAEVLRLLEFGRSTEQIAHELHLSTETVRNHIRHILRALNAHSRLEAVAIGRREQLVAS
jgi:DNA-binding NarL/FixJ family response regulator